MDNQLEVEPPAESPRPAVRKRRTRHPALDLAVTLGAVGLVVVAILLVQAIRSGGESSPSQIAFANDGFTPIKLGISSSGRSSLGDTAPTFQLTNPDGTVVSLTDFRGKPVLVNFWATWCAPCRREIPDLVKLQEQWGDSVAIIGVDLNESAGTVADYARTMGMSYPLALDVDGSVTSAYKLTGLPETFFLDGNGVIRDHRIGLLRPEIAQCVVNDLLQGSHDPGNCR